VSVRTIFCVYERKPGSDGSADDLLRSGAECICAGYVTYSSAVELVFTFRGAHVHGFCLDSTIGEFIHTREMMMFPEDEENEFTNATKETLRIGTSQGV
jgi:fructose-1,6-bisphosphatase I